MPKVSLIVPVYNTEKYLPRCLESLLGQTLKDIEIICVDDGSTDNSLKVLRKCQKGFPDKIKIIALPKSSGSPAIARNRALAEAASPYVMFCDSDDHLARNACELLYKAITAEKDLDFAACGTHVIYEAHPDMQSADEYYYRNPYQGIKTLSAEITRDLTATVTDKIFHLAKIRENQIEFPPSMRYEDAYFMYYYALLSKKANFIPEKLLFYTRHAGSIMTTTWSFSIAEKSALDHLRIFVKLRHDFGDKLSNPDLFWQLATEYFVAAYEWSKTAKIRRSVRKELKKFLAEYREEIKNNISENAKKHLRRLTVVWYYSALHRFLIALRKKLKH